jgi:hypothetical protein
VISAVFLLCNVRAFSIIKICWYVASQISAIVLFPPGKKNIEVAGCKTQAGSSDICCFPDCLHGSSVEAMLFTAGEGKQTV